MKSRIIFTAFILLIACCLCACASAEEAAGYSVDLPDEITVGLNEFITSTYSYPTTGYVYMSIRCSDSSALSWSSSVIEKKDGITYERFSMKYLKEGQFTVTFQHQSFSKVVTVNVQEAASYVTDKSRYVIPLGETVQVQITKTGGVSYNGLKIGCYNNSNHGLTINNENYTITGNIPGTYTMSLNSVSQYLFNVLVVEPSTNVLLTPKYDKVCVGYRMEMPVIDSNGKTVCAEVAITEGAEYASLYYNTNNNVTICTLNPTAPGWITVTARGTDGSTDVKRIRIYEAPSDVHAVVPSLTLPVGESMNITIDYPEDSWYPVSMGLSSQYLPDGLTGAAAKLENGVVTGLMPGTCTLTVSSMNVRETYKLTITDSEKALRIIRPINGFDWRKPYQMSVRDRNGRVHPAEFSIANNRFQLTKDGLLTASGKGQDYITVKLENGEEYRFTVNAVDTPSWMQPKAGQESLSIHLNEGEIIYGVDSDIGTLSSTQWVMCSTDETVIKCSGQTITPVGLGTAAVRIWSLYCDVYCEIPVTVTAATNKLYINGAEEGSLEVPDGGSVSLPTVKDFSGKTISVKWKITHQYKGEGNPNSYCIKLDTRNKKVTGYWGYGNATLTGTADSGATIKVNVSTYFRSVTAAFEKTQYQIETGKKAYVDFFGDQGGNGAYLTANDITYTLSGDTDCVVLDPLELSCQRHTYLGVKPGTVTLTAKLWNKKTYSAVITVTQNPKCANGHKLAWRETTAPRADRNGEEEQYCVNCGLAFDHRTVACTGTIEFSQPEYFVTTSGDMQIATLGTNLSGDPKQSFTWRSSDPTIAKVEADRVTGLKAGTATITATRGDCTPATCTIHVINAASITVFRLPGSVRKIEAGAFEGIAATHVSVPKSTVSIGSRAFADCPRLMMISIPASVTKIAGDAFAGSAQVMISCPAGSYAAQYAGEHGIPLAP